MRRFTIPVAPRVIGRIRGADRYPYVAAINQPLSPHFDIVSHANERQKRRSHDVRHYHSSSLRESGLIFLGVTMTGAALAVKYGMNIYNDYQAKKAKEAPQDQVKAEGSAPSPEEETKREEATVNSKASTDSSKASDDTSSNAKKEANTSGSSFNFDFLNMFGKNFYDGGFEDKMTKREAALILGVRESATVERIKEAHRRILLNNHPDRGGSPYMASKINEAKDLLMKSKGSS